MADEEVDIGSTTPVIDEGSQPLDGQFPKAVSYSTNDDTPSQDSAARAKTPRESTPCVTTNRELFLSLHKKVDCNHKWVKR